MSLSLTNNKKNKKNDLLLTKKPETTIKPNNIEESHDGVLLKIFILITTFKILLIPTYHSTDFEVHRNWLAISHSLPINEWYINNTSEWTLDYPPLFAWFELILSQIGKLIDPEMLRVNNLNYASFSTKLFQRSTVMITDIFLVFGAREIGKVYHDNFNKLMIYYILTICNIGLLMIDHIHFQYNGFLLGILLLSIAQVSKNQPMSILIGAAYFAILLNLKHLYLYVAPVFIVWLIKWYCMKGNFLIRLIQLGSIVIGVLAISFGPFITQLPQVFSRLFPFKRGLVHAYWAPNFWALYIGADKILSVLWKKFGLLVMNKRAAMTGGLVQEDTLAVLPTPTPIITFLLTILTIMPILVIILKKKTNLLRPHDFLRGLILCGLSSFMFGWHVHEKAILTAIIPMCIMATIDPIDGRIFLILSATGHASILPLLYPDNLVVLKILLLLIHIILADYLLCKLFKFSLLKIYEYFYILLLPIVAIYHAFIHKIIFDEKMEFLPLALTSLYSAIGITYCWILYFYYFYTNNYQLSNNSIKNK